MKRLMKRILLCLCAFTMAFSCGTVFAKATGADLALEKMEIVLPTEATEVEKTAAEELALYVNKMTGATMKTVTEGQQSGKAVYIGATQFAADNEVTFEDNEFGEGWAIKAVDGNLVLTGGAVRGTLYAAYYLLEDVLGVRWWNPWEEYVPALSSATVPADYDDADVPDFLYRDIFVNNSWETLFFVRNRINGWVSNTPVAYGSEENFGMPHHVHTIDRFFPAYYEESSGEYQEWLDAVGNPEHVNYFEEHPEWYEMNDVGSRSPNTHMCLTNEELRQAYAEKMLANIKYCYEKADAEGVPRPRYFNISPKDKAGYCVCDACMESIEKHGQSGNLLNFVNYVANAVAEVYPEVWIETLAYQLYKDVPLDDTKPADNVVIRFANNKMDILHSLNHENNAVGKAQLEKWMEITKPGNLYVWDYAVTYFNNGVFPSMYKYSENFQLIKQMGINGYFVEHQSPANTDFWDMKLWLMTKLMEDVEQDYDALMDEFIYGYYGKDAGPYIRQYLDHMHQKAEATGMDYIFSDDIISNSFLTVEDVVQGNAYFEQANAAVGDDEVLLKRLRAARSGLDRLIADKYIMWQMNAEYLEIEWTIDQRELLERILATLTEQLEMKGETYWFDINTAMDKYKLDLKLLGVEYEPVVEETEEATEPPVTEEVVPTTEPAEELQENNNQFVIIIAAAAGVIVFVTLAVVLIKKKGAKK